MVNEEQIKPEQSLGFFLIARYIKVTGLWGNRVYFMVQKSEEHS
ncbi:hypothetical protein C942_03594 [Photobacterium marinum]|uniref:Uncharacterized protein n=1 Tax=Photobacterium marinum TaxID=1056511 RepID=L8J5V0_9GAMM|nr:hypothetical protein C942_03594 [Photobacterium marinum]